MSLDVDEEAVDVLREVGFAEQLPTAEVYI